MFCLKTLLLVKQIDLSKQYRPSSDANQMLQNEASDQGLLSLPPIKSDILC